MVKEDPNTALQAIIGAAIVIVSDQQLTEVVCYENFFSNVFRVCDNFSTALHSDADPVVQDLAI